MSSPSGHAQPCAAVARRPRRRAQLPEVLRRVRRADRVPGPGGVAPCIRVRDPARDPTMACSAARRARLFRLRVGRQNAGKDQHACMHARSLESALNALDEPFRRCEIPPPLLRANVGSSAVAAATRGEPIPDFSEPVSQSTRSWKLLRADRFGGSDHAGTAESEDALTLQNVMYSVHKVLLG